MKVNRREAIGIGVATAGSVTGPALARQTGPARSGITALKVCGLTEPLALGDLTPRFSWQLALPDTRVRQTAYRIRVARNRADLAEGTNLLWDSGRITSPQTVDIPYSGPPLSSRQQAHWQVQVWTTPGSAPLQSLPATWETGLGPDDWQGEWLASETLTARADRLAGLHWITGPDALKAGQERGFRWSVDFAQAAAAELCLSAHETTGVWLILPAMRAMTPATALWAWITWGCCARIKPSRACTAGQSRSGLSELRRLGRWVVGTPRVVIASPKGLGPSPPTTAVNVAR